MDSQNCAICMTASENLERINKEGENWLKTLKKITPEIEWYEFYNICTECIQQLETIHKFREFCIGKEPERLACLSTQTTCKVEHQDLAVINDIECKVEFDPENADSLQYYYYEEDNESITINLGLEEIKSECDSEKSGQRLKSTEIGVENRKLEKGRRQFWTFKCPTCEFQSKYTKPLTKHCIEVHKMTESDVKPYSCELCPFRYKSITSLKEHNSKIHSEERNYLCTVCRKLFKTEKVLKCHQKSHRNRKIVENLECKECDRTFNKKSNYTFHQLSVHTNPKLWRFQCEFCSRQFPVKSSLEQHVKRHRGEKIFKCDSCPKACVSQGDLNKHLLSHQEMKRFLCEICAKSFRTKSYYEFHMTKMHDVGEAIVPIKEKTLACHLCPKLFSHRYHLHRHIKAHRDHDRDRCETCSRLFRNIRDLENRQKVGGIFWRRETT